MKLKIINYLFYKLLDLYIEETDDQSVAVNIKIYMFNKKYAEFVAEGSTAQAEYDSFRNSAKSGTINSFSSNILFRQLRKEKSWKYAKLMSIVNKYANN